MHHDPRLEALSAHMTDASAPTSGPWSRGALNRERKLMTSDLTLRQPGESSVVAKASHVLGAVLLHRPVRLRFTCTDREAAGRPPPTLRPVLSGELERSTEVVKDYSDELSVGRSCASVMSSQ